MTGSVSKDGVANGVASTDVLNQKIDGFPGYDDDVAREQSDEMVRSYLGERLADLQQRLQPLDATLSDRIGELLLRTAFINQTVHKLYDGGAKVDLESVTRSDEKAIALADRASSVDAEHVGAYLDEVDSVLDERDAAMSGKVY